MFCVNVGDRCRSPPQGLLPFVAWRLDADKQQTVFMAEGQLKSAGSLVAKAVELNIMDNPGMPVEGSFLFFEARLQRLLTFVVQQKKNQTNF